MAIKHTPREVIRGKAFDIFMVLDMLTPERGVGNFADGGGR